MFTLYRPANYNNPRASSFVGLSTDEKPLDEKNGASFEEIDTGKVFRFDEENKVWHEEVKTSTSESFIANEFSTSSTYAVGDYVIYEGQLYQCITAVTTAGSWNSSNWTQAVLGNDVNELKSAFTSQEGIAKKYYFVNSGSTHSSESDTIKIKIYAGEQFSVYMKTTLNVAIYTEIKAYYSDGTSEKIFTGNTPKTIGLYNSFTASKDIKELGFYSNPATSSYVFNIGVCTDKTLGNLLSYLLNGSTNNVDTLNSQQSIAKSHFTVLKNTNHSSDDDVCLIKASAGETIGVYTKVSKSGNTYIQVFAKYEDGTSTRFFADNISGSYYQTFTLEKDLKGIGYYASGATSAYQFTAFVVTNTTLDEILGNAIQSSSAWTSMLSTQNLLIDNQSIRSKSFTVAANTTHNSSSDVLMIPIAQGEKFRVNLHFDTENLNFNSYMQLFAFKSDGTMARISDGFYWSINYLTFTAEYNIIGFGVYMLGQTYGYTCTISVARAKTAMDIFENVYGYKDAENSIFTSTKVKDFSALFNGSTEVDSYIFFTDPHVLRGYSNFSKADLAKIEYYLIELSQYAEAISANTILCGGDWLNSGDTKVIACYKLRLLKGLTDKYFSGYNYHNLLGNHDSNYQGKADTESEINTGALTQQTINNILYNSDKAYFRFDTPNTTYFCLDTGTDWSVTMDSYRWEQIDWLCNQLLTETKDNIIIAMHIFANQGTIETFENYITPMATNVVTAIEGYNARTSITLNEITYNFANATKVVRCVLTGHTHFDTLYTTNGGIPVVCTTDATDAGTSPIMFDMGFLDYTNGTLKIFRIGDGSDRTVTLKSIS